MKAEFPRAMLNVRFAFTPAFGSEKCLFFIFAEWQQSSKRRRKGKAYSCGFAVCGKRVGTVLVPAL